VAAVLGEPDVRLAARRGERWLYVDAGTIVSPSARDAAATLGVELRAGPAPKTAVVGTDHARAVQRGLYRRSPRWVAPAPRRGIAPVRFDRLVIVGSGAVGSTTAHLAAASSVAAEIVLIDLVPGLAAATALDIQHATGLTGAAVRTRGSSDVADVAGADVVVVTAGRPRTPGMSRADLASVNARVVRDVAAAIAAHAPEAVVIVVTNPVDEMTHALWQASGLAEDRVIGMAGTLDASRFRAAIAAAAEVAPADVDATTLGSHGDEMVPIVSSATVKGRPLREVLSAATVAECVRNTVDGGAHVVALRRTGSASIAPAHAIVEVLDAMRGARAGVVPVSVRVRGQYGIDGVFLGVPAVLSPRGVDHVVEIPLSSEEHTALRDAAKAVRARCES
jgi:malate dehydrogenase